MKNLTLNKVTTGSANGKYTYQVIEDGKVIATRKSNRNYIACYVTMFTTNNEIQFATPYFFSRMDLVGKGDSAKHTPDYFYAFAKIV